MIYNIIGDIHGRDYFHEVVMDDAVNVFVGDYFSPYDNISFSKQTEVFTEITKLKTDRPDTILLIGNHDEDHWHIREMYSRYDWRHVNDITEMFEVCKGMFQLAYSIGERYLVTHAGVVAPWFVNAKKFMEGDREYSHYPTLYPYSVETLLGFDELPIDEAYRRHMMEFVKEMKFDLNNIPSKFGSKMEHPSGPTLLCTKNGYYLYMNDTYEKITTTPSECAELINSIWLGGYYKLFDFRSNCDRYDGYGESNVHGPLWVRPDTLSEYNIFRNDDVMQIVGHTQVKDACCDGDKIGRCDCLGYSVGSIVIDTDKPIGEQVTPRTIRTLPKYKYFY